MNKIIKSIRRLYMINNFKDQCIRSAKVALVLVCLLFSSLLFSGCKLYTVVSNDKNKDSQQGVAVEDFDANAFVNSVWESKVIPTISQKAVDIGEVIKATTNNADEAGKKYGIRSAQEGSPWNFIVKGKGRILHVNKESRAGTLDVDLAPYDGKPDFKIQIGPVIKNTAVRDSFEFIKYDDFKNQMVFAELSNAFHKKITETLLSKNDFANSKEKEVNFNGVFTYMPSSEILVTPIIMEFTEGDK